MNRRFFTSAIIAGLLIAPVQKFSAQTPDATPNDSPPYAGHFYTPLATSVITTTYWGPEADPVFDTTTLEYRLFTFVSSEDALNTFDTLQDQIEGWIGGSGIYEQRWNEQISIGQVGEDSFGYLNADSDGIEGVLVGGDQIAHFSLFAMDVISEYEEHLETLFQNRRSIGISISDLPVGWSEKLGPKDVTDRHAPI